ncbi:zf-HC2 domain-containing protein [Roseateles violae]|uniref:Zf-HC2 domain-containing protein n=1 Tax=Roseateles violae TaxID=3058042 RepID=A0ABT8DU67_9BURK|nr:zf-HC2 domain-containing protein [Pelomonas sp. PFR6]MDN3919859.1 zf-HC2 domain-containing protein [Pelomonas sp. PFR6]
MSEHKVVPIERDPHHAVQALLPWYLRGRLEAEEQLELQRHLLACPQCRAECEAERRLLAELSPRAERSAEPGDVEAGLRRLRARLPARAEARAARPSLPRWLGWALGLQGTALAGLLAMLLFLPRPQPADYHGLSAAAPAIAADALVMFDPAATEAQIRQALRASGARLVGGPTGGNAWLLQLGGDAAARRHALERLRAERIVSLAEPLQAEGGR